jgi:hypothetical protein
MTVAGQEVLIGAADRAHQQPVLNRAAVDEEDIASRPWRG